MSNYGSDMIDFDKAGMKDALRRIEKWSENGSPFFWIKGFFPVSIDYGYNLSLDGKGWEIISLYPCGKLQISKGVRLR